MIKKLSRSGYSILLFILILLSAGCVKSSNSAERLRAGFDVDDTLLYSSPAFQKGFESSEHPFSPGFWEVVNNSDHGNSVIKKKASQILKDHQAEGFEIFVITARHPQGGEGLKEFLNSELDILIENIFFETEGKAERMIELELDMFYGDSDSDITAAQEAGVIPYRIQRSTTSSYKRNYNPGRYGEKVIEGSAW
ncbi:HAD family acid phosphatase [Elusimicrobiota bacterium]